ncbi:MAG: CoA transferase [Dehalococcoidia bacterium]|nr:CoA transferase [Dehalococcoidia bacterium]
MTKLPLEGIRVADFTWWIAGTMATRLLAAYGAHVIKIESTIQRDQIRENAQVQTGTASLNASPGFNGINPGKMSMTLNPKHPRGLEVARRIISVSDIVADNMTWGAMARLGLGYDDLVKINPAIIVLTMPVMGPGGPDTNFTGNGEQIAASAAMHHLTGYPEELGMAPGPVYPDWASNPYHAVTAVMAALYHKLKTGKGQHIVLSQYESVVNVTALPIMDYSVNGRVQTRMGNRSPYGAPHGVYRCQGEDRWCAIAVYADEEWEGLCRAMGDPEWSQGDKFGTALGRSENVDELERLLEQWTSARSAEEVMKTLQAHGVAAGVVQNGRDLLENDPQLKARDHYVRMEHPEIGSMAFDDYPFKLSKTPGRLSRHAPLIGEHNDFVTGELLGMSEDEVNELIIEGVLE